MPTSATPPTDPSHHIAHQKSPKSNRGILVGVTAMLLVAVAAGAAIGLKLMSRATETAAPSPTSAAPAAQTPVDTPEPVDTPVEPIQSSPTPASETPSAPTIDPAEEAMLLLNARAVADASSITFEGQWVAQLASKYVGITDPLQTASNGTPFYAADILAESEALASRVGGARVVLLDSTSYGSRFNHEGDPLWVTLALSPRFSSKEVVRSWCAEQFPELTGDDLTNQCVPRQLNP